MIDYSLLPISKGHPRVVAKMLRTRERDKAERDCRAKVDARDQRQCFYPRCRMRASDKHHIVASSLRGKRVWLTHDILSACRRHHDWFKSGLIVTHGNPDHGPVTVCVTPWGEELGIRVPVRK